MKNDILKFVFLSVLLLLLCSCASFCGNEDDDRKSNNTQETVPIQVFDQTINFPKVR